MVNFRIGHGFDVHALSAGEGLIIGGVRIPHHRSLMAHSDGDVLIHALCDALLGAMARGDIGTLFSDSDPTHKDRDSREFLVTVKKLMDDDNYVLGNADITIVAQAPKMAPHLAAMKQNLVADLVANSTQINLKATTTEKLGFAGREEGIAVHAVVLLESVV
ncbi:MAG: 2-C-methyl-D-erythritol 2,4-cyclodiphosphate synthase [Gammaproteobacteria bacterium]|nr:2-C-methyl-D-erythritol 2,4-cyclodiphosphate synthase [Gammaproteobacteria bacterium]